MNIKIEDEDCPSCEQLKAIQQIISDLSFHDSIDTVNAIDILASEIRMRRAKEIYEIKLKTSIIGYAKDFFDKHQDQ